MALLRVGTRRFQAAIKGAKFKMIHYRDRRHIIPACNDSPWIVRQSTPRLRCLNYKVLRIRMA
jgi:hypothetical protein